MYLEAIYEPIFSDRSHGFRPNRSCHTALTQISKGFNGTKWFIEGDIKGCFDNIDHTVLLSLLAEKIKDTRFVNLIGKFLKAGYMEQWKYNATYSGTPQGGIISPRSPPRTATMQSNSRAPSMTAAPIATGSAQVPCIE